MPPKDLQTYVLVISDDREFQDLMPQIMEKYPEAEAVQALTTGYLTAKTQLVCAFYVGNGITNKKTGRERNRQPVISEPVKTADHWTGGQRGRLGELRIGDFLTAVSASNKTAANALGQPSNVSVRRQTDGKSDELSLIYG